MKLSKKITLTMAFALLALFSAESFAAPCHSNVDVVPGYPGRLVVCQSTNGTYHLHGGQVNGQPPYCPDSTSRVVAYQCLRGEFGRVYKVAGANNEGLVCNNPLPGHTYELCEHYF